MPTLFTVFASVLSNWLKLCAVFTLHRGFTYSAWRGKGDSKRLFFFFFFLFLSYCWLVELKSDFPQRKNPAPFIPGKRVFERKTE